MPRPARSCSWTINADAALGGGPRRGCRQAGAALVPIGEGISGGVAATGVPVRIEDAQHDPRWIGRRYDAETGFTTRSILCVPITAHDRIIGVIQVLNRRGGPFTDDDQRLLEALASMGAVAIENARLYENLEDKVQERTARPVAHARRAARDAGPARTVGEDGRPRDLVAGVRP